MEIRSFANESTGACTVYTGSERLANRNDGLGWLCLAVSEVWRGYVLASVAGWRWPEEVRGWVGGGWLGLANMRKGLGWLTCVRAAGWGSSTVATRSKGLGWLGLAKRTARCCLECNTP